MKLFVKVIKLFPYFRESTFLGWTLPRINIKSQLSLMKQHLNIITINDQLIMIVIAKC